MVELTLRIGNEDRLKKEKKWIYKHSNYKTNCNNFSITEPNITYKTTMPLFRY